MNCLRPVYVSIESPTADRTDELRRVRGAPDETGVLTDPASDEHIVMLPPGRPLLMWAAGILRAVRSRARLTVVRGG